MRIPSTTWLPIALAFCSSVSGLTLELSVRSAVGEEMIIADGGPYDSDAAPGRIDFAEEDLFGNEVDIVVDAVRDESGLRVQSEFLLSGGELAEDLILRVTMLETAFEDAVAHLGVRGHLQGELEWSGAMGSCGETPAFETYSRTAGQYEEGELAEVTDVPFRVGTVCHARLEVSAGMSGLPADGFVSLESELRFQEAASNDRPETGLLAPLGESMAFLTGASERVEEACEPSSGPGLWYGRTASVDGTLRVETTDSLHPLTLALFDEGSMARGEPLACGVDAVEAAVAPGESLYAAVMAGTEREALEAAEPVAFTFTESIPGPRGLVCLVREETMRLEWENGASYEAIEVHVNGEVIAVLPGETSSFQLDLPDSPEFDVCLVPALEVPDGVTIESACCSDLTAFVRGDVNADGRLDIADASALLGCLFRDGTACRCASASDANDDERIDISDPVALLIYLFQGGADLPPPHLECGLASSVFVCQTTPAGCPPILAQQRDDPPPAPPRAVGTRTRVRRGMCEAGVDMRLRVTDARGRQIPKKTKRGILFSQLKPGIRIKSNSKIVIQSSNAAAAPYEGDVKFEFFRGPNGQQRFHMFGKHIEDQEAMRAFLRGTRAPEMAAPAGMSAQNNAVTEVLRVKMTWDPDDPTNPDQCCVESSLTIRWRYEGPAGTPGWSPIVTAKLGKFKEGKTRVRLDPELREVPFDNDTNHATHTEVYFGVKDPFVCCEDRNKEHTIIQFVRHRWKLRGSRTRRDDWNLDGPDSQHQNHSQGRPYDPTYPGNSQLVEFGPWGESGGAVTVTDFPGLLARDHQRFAARGGKMQWEFYTLLVCRETPATAQQYLGHSKVRAYVRYKVTRTYKKGNPTPAVKGKLVKSKSFDPCISLMKLLQDEGLLNAFNNPRAHVVNFGP